MAGTAVWEMYVARMNLYESVCICMNLYASVVVVV